MSSNKIEQDLKKTHDGVQITEEDGVTYVMIEDVVYSTHTYVKKGDKWSYGHLLLDEGLVAKAIDNATLIVHGIKISDFSEMLKVAERCHVNAIIDDPNDDESTMSFVGRADDLNDLLDALEIEEREAFLYA